MLNAGHDFVLLYNWPPRPVEGHLYRPAGHRVYAARWKPSFVARYAPDLSGRYEWDGETLDVCTVQDGVLGEGRMAAYLHSQDGGFSAIATGRWSVEQGGYAGVMIHSNDTTHSGPLLLYGHRDGSVRVRSGAFYYSPETLRDMAPSFPRMVPVFRGYTAAACDLLPPRPRLAQMRAPDLSGNYLSNYNESITVCTRGGSLVAAISGVGYQQGFAMGRWVDAAGRWEGTVAEIGRDSHPFTWRLAGDVLSGDWSVYNRTNPWAENSTRPAAWEARRDPATNPSEMVLPFALAAAYLSLEHLCALLIAADSGQRAEVSETNEEEWVSASQPARLPDGLGGRILDLPRFALLCRNERYTYSTAAGRRVVNSTEVCEEDPGLYDVDGFGRRAPTEQRYSWHADEVVLTDSGNEGASSAVVAPLLTGERYIFRVRPIYAGVLPPPPPPTYWEALHAQRQEELPELLRDPPQPPPPPPPPSLGDITAYSRPVLIDLTGPGAPTDLRIGMVFATAVELSWRAPLPTQTGLWHGDGGSSLVGYRVFVRAADQPESEFELAASVPTTTLTLRDLRPQMFLVFRVCAVNRYGAGLNSTAVSVATSALRATLWTDCNYSTTLHQPLAYQGCFRDPEPETAADMPFAFALPGTAHTLSAAVCAAACAEQQPPTTFFGLRAGSHCLCAETFGRYGAVEDHECDTPCTGEPGRLCGSAERISVYRRPGAHGILLGVGRYYTYDLLQMRLPARSLSSVSLPEGLVLELYTQDALRGLRVRLNASVPCLRTQACPFDPHATTWAEPAARCVDDVWDDQAASLELRYADTAPGYTPRPSAETGARAFALGRAGRLSRLLDLGGDPSQTASDRPRGVGLTGFWRAPRQGDPEECELRRGSYSSDNVCLQPARILPSIAAPRRSPFAWLNTMAELDLQDRFTEEHARRMRLEWRATLFEYARPFFEAAMGSQLNQSASRIPPAAPDAPDAPPAQQVAVIVPAGAMPGSRFLVPWADGTQLEVTVPVGAAPGQELTVDAPAGTTTYTVSGGSFASPYYSFSPPLAALRPGGRFIFRADGISSTHPFSIGPTQSQALPATFGATGNVDGLTGTGGMLSFTLPIGYSGPLVYYCTRHTIMLASLSIAVPMQPSISPLTGSSGGPAADEPELSAPPANRTRGLNASSNRQLINETSYVDWFEAWLAGLLHLRLLLSTNDITGAPPVLGFSVTGEVVPWDETTAQPLPPHPFPRAEPIEPQTLAPEALRTARHAGPTGPIHEPSLRYRDTRLEARARLYPDGAAYPDSPNATSNQSIVGAVAASRLQEEPFFGTVLR